METVVNRKLYEGMFLVDSAQAADWDATRAVIEAVLKRAEAEIVEMKKWDDRRLAYEVDGKARGTYILSYFNADCDKIQEVEKAVQLSEQIMRVLILNAEQMTEEDIKKDTPIVKAEKEAAAEEAKAVRPVETAEEAESVEVEASDLSDEKPEAGEGGEVVPGVEALELEQSAMPPESEEAGEDLEEPEKEEPKES
ncbi:MAG: 30S ribosomal protein S6 [Planctomycetota bacterium]|jgi:small subunit ribosomal protein S6